MHAWVYWQWSPIVMHIYSSGSETPIRGTPTDPSSCGPSGKFGTVLLGWCCGLVGHGCSLLICNFWIQRCSICDPWSIPIRSVFLPWFPRGLPQLGKIHQSLGVVFAVPCRGCSGLPFHLTTQPIKGTTMIRLRGTLFPPKPLNWMLMPFWPCCNSTIGSSLISLVCRLRPGIF